MPPDPVPADSSASERNSEALWEAITRFNLFPAQYWHDSWRERLIQRIGPIAPDLDSQPFWIRALSATILRERWLEDRFDFEFADRVKRLALLDAATLYRLCLAIAGLSVRQHLRLLVSRDDANLIQRCLGKEVHRLVLEWRGPVPVAAPMPWSADWRSNWAESDALARQGVATLCSALPHELQAVHGRLRLKFPVQWPDTCFTVSTTVDHQQLNGNVILRILPLVAPSWSWLFAENVTTTEVAA